ncbi:hypothetical protein RMATCC62417_08088 [Rhizopus microsporus]|nr:hypothetical protein RMATCC62417_08088 [Rhizopus microsporus]
MSLTDQEFRAKLEQHFSLYRINLRCPLDFHVKPNRWYRVDILLVNELGLFRRSDIEPDGQVAVACSLQTPSETGITPLEENNDHDWEIELAPAPSFQNGQLAKDPAPIPGFYRSGRGAFLYRIQPKHEHVKSGKRFLRIQSDSKFATTIQSLTVGPIMIDPDWQPENDDTSLPLELWNNYPQEMVHDGYRVFSDGQVAIHEMWDTGIPGKIWDSALVTLEVMKRMYGYHPEYLSSKHILDLSAGTGLLGLYTASIMGSCSVEKGKVTMTELEEAVRLIDKNVKVNQHLTKRCDLKTRELAWGNKEQAEQCSKVDLIIASDVLYEAHFFQDLVKTLVDLSKDTTRIYIGYKRRGFSQEEEQTFWNLCESNGFQVTLLEYDRNQDVDDILVPSIAVEIGVQIYRLLPV